MEDIRITLVQSDIHWQSVDANLSMYEEKLWASKPATDLIILPEMFNTGFTMDVKKFAEPMNSKTFRWMKLIAGQFQAVVTGSFIVAESNRYYNRLIWMEPGGNFHFYDKRHLFRMSEEKEYFTSGLIAESFETKGWKIRPLICYDLRFPVWARNKMTENREIFSYDLLLLVANWPKSRIQIWDTLLKARAIENSSYCIGVNRIGLDGEDIEYNGHSGVYNYKGETLMAPLEGEAVHHIVLSAESLFQYRRKFPVHYDGDDFSILS